MCMCIGLCVHMLANGEGSAASLAIRHALTHKLMHVWSTIDTLVYLIVHMHNGFSTGKHMCVCIRVCVRIVHKGVCAHART